jgi:L-lactate utilization protein LutB
VSAELEYLQVTEPPYPGPIKKIIETTPAHMRAFGYELAAAPCITLSTEWTPVELDLTNPLVDWRKKTIPIKAERYRLRFQRQRSRPASVGDVTKFKRAVKHRVQKWVKHPTPTRSPTVEKEYREQFGLTQTQSRDAMRELREAGIIPKAWSTRGRNPGLAKMLDRGGDYL